MKQIPPPRKRLRELGVKTGYLPCGPLNSICDLKGLEVGHCTLVSGQGDLVPGKGPVRTGVTVLIPHDGDLWNDRPSAGFFSLNGCGVVSGSDWINECGALEGPIALTNSHSVGDMNAALTRYMLEKHPEIGVSDDAYLPVVAECDDSTLNDINGFHVKDRHLIEAINNATSMCAEGAVGAGTGMSCYGFKGGIGTASRLIEFADSNYIVGVLVNTNHGQSHQLLIDGVPVGRILSQEAEYAQKNKEGSIVILLATDAPMNQRQLERMAKRACLGLARTGSSAGNGSGDFALAISLSRRVARKSPNQVLSLPEIHNELINKFFEAAAEASEEAILNSIFVADTVCGRDNNVSKGLPVERCLEILKEQRRI